MTEDKGSRWYFPVYEGLFEAKHVAAMGPAIWLYGWILARAWAAQKEGVIAYSHADAVVDLGVCEKTVRLWFSRLQEYGYLITRARHPHHLEIEVSNWRSIEEWLKTRTKADGAGMVKSYHSEVENGNVIGNVIGNSFLPSISINLLTYKYPNGSQGDGPPTLSGAFAGFLEQLKTSTNKQAMLKHLYSLCFTGDAPDYGYLGKVAKAVGGAGRLAEIMWQLSTKPPTGDIMAYILAAYGSKARGNGKNGNARASTVDWDAVAAEEMRKWKEASSYGKNTGTVD